MNEESAQLPRASVWQQAVATIFASLKKRSIRVLLLLVCGVVARLPALQGELIWDDKFLIFDNPLIKSPLLTFETFRHHLLLDSFSAHYRPVQNISYAVDYLIWNTDWSGYHLSSVLWHVAGGLLLYLLLETLLCRLVRQSRTAISDELADERKNAITSATAFLIALLWVVHPVHSAAIDYLSGRADSLAFVFGCGAWLLYLKAQAAPRAGLRIALYGASAFSMLLALGSRESACIWLAIFLFHLFALERRVGRKLKWVTLTGCLLVLAVYGGLRQLPDSRPNPNPTHGWSVPFRGVLMLRALGDYAGLMVFPTNLHMERSIVHDKDIRSEANARPPFGFGYLAFAGLMVAAGLAYGATRKGPAQALRVLGAVWFIGGYLPISNVVDLNATVAEHWLYLPSVGALLFLAGCGLELPVRWHRYAITATCVAVVCLTARSVVRSSDWVSPQTFYERTIAAGGVSARLMSNLAQIYVSKGELGKAEVTFRKVLQISPGFVMARNNLAALLKRQGRVAEADALFVEAKSIAAREKINYPRTWVAAVNVARAQAAAGDVSAAAANFEKARLDYPGRWAVIDSEAEFLRETHGPAAAMARVEEFARANWWHASAHLALGRLRTQVGDFAGAETAFRHAIRLDVHDPEALNAIAEIKVRQDRLEEALKLQQRAVARRPDEPRQLVFLSSILTRLGRSDDARRALAQVSAMQADAHAAVN